MWRFFFLALLFENNLFTLVRVTNQLYALCWPSSVDVDVDNDTSSAVRGFQNFFHDEELVCKCGWLTENTTDSKINEPTGQVSIIE